MIVLETVRRADEAALQVVPESENSDCGDCQYRNISGVRLCRGAARSDATVEMRINYEQVKIESDFQQKCRKGAKFAAHTAFWAILGEISCLFSLALEFFTRFRGGSFQPLTHLSASDGSCQETALRRQQKKLTTALKERLQ